MLISFLKLVSLLLTSPAMVASGRVGSMRGPAALLAKDHKVNASRSISNASARATSISNASAPTPHTMTSVFVLQAVLKNPQVQPDRYAVNFGAGDGLCMIPAQCGAADALGHGDPVYPLFKNFGYGGLAVEGNPQLLPFLTANLPGQNIAKVTSFITPVSAVGLLTQSKAPLDMDYFKNDIDSYDCAVLYSVLKSGYKPKIIQVEVNPEIPYPIVFGVNFKDGFKSNLGNAGFYGCSLTLAAGLTQPFGYDLVAVSLTHDVIFVRHDLVAASGLQAMTVEQAQDEQAVCCLAPNGVGHFGQLSNYNLLNKYRQTPDFMLKAMVPAVEQACVMSQGSPTGKCDTPYTLSLNVQDFITQYEQLMR
jgi:hypothetical protein